jgi:Tfp pilus assembly protein PilO
MITKLDTEHKKDIKKIEDGVPDDHYIPSLFSEIKKIAQETGVKVENLTDFSESEYEKKASIGQTEIDLQVEGGYSNFKLFLEKLKKSARIITFKEIIIKKPSAADEEKTSILEYSLKIGVFSYINNNGK